MPDGPLFLTHHARNRMRRDKVTPGDVQKCVSSPDVVREDQPGRKNYWVTLGDAFLRVTIVEEADRVVAVSVVVKKRPPK